MRKRLSARSFLTLDKFVILECILTYRLEYISKPSEIYTHNSLIVKRLNSIFEASYMRLLQTFSILCVVFAIIFAIAAPAVIACDYPDNFELFETDQENQTEHEESQEELADDDFKNEFIYSAFTDDLTLSGQFINFKQLHDNIFSELTSPPPEQV